MGTIKPVDSFMRERTEVDRWKQERERYAEEQGLNKLRAHNSRHIIDAEDDAVYGRSYVLIRRKPPRP